MGLERAYSRVRDIIGREAESLEVAEEVERLRWMWRPERVRVVMLAESHVWTSRHETGSRVAQPNGADTGFARFVYCLGYGEPELVEPAVTPNLGTPHYWKLFHDTVCEPTRTSHLGVMKIGEREFQRRVRNKLDLLNKMQRAGVWLVDASITALYRKGQKLVTGADYKAVLNGCWNSHIGKLLSDCAPSAVLVVGRGVYDALEDALRRDLGGVNVEFIHQPNARMSREVIDRYRLACFNLCRLHGTGGAASP
jgi:hypothetical protein